MAGNALFEVCGGVISGLTRSVTERLVNTNEAGLNSDSFGYDPLESGKRFRVKKVLYLSSALYSVSYTERLHNTSCP